ncbi:effector-associated constant component EACC1 [Streptacidiphilus sp. PAMC 29251]
MDIVVAAECPDAGDQLRSLYEWLAEVQQLRGRVDLSETPPEPGTLGPVLDALTVALGPGGAATAFATGLIAWLRSRRGDVHIKVTLPDRSSLELTAKRVSDLDTTALQQQVDHMAALLRPEPPRTDPSEHRRLP